MKSLFPLYKTLWIAKNKCFFLRNFGFLRSHTHIKTVRLVRLHNCITNIETLFCNSIDDD
jgi:hypothetical protein